MYACGGFIAVFGICVLVVCLSVHIEYERVYNVFLRYM